MKGHRSADRDSAAAVLDDPPPRASAVSAQLGGIISDSQVAVGNGNMQVSTGGGDCIINQAVHRPPRPREAIRVLPRPQPQLLGRDDEVALARAAVAGREPVQFHGPRGSGKTALLRHVAHASTGACPEGIVYFRAAGTSLDDLLQTLFDVLFETDLPTKRTPGQLASDLAGWEVLFVLDDLGLDEDELETLLDIVPMSVFVLSSARRTLWNAGEGAELRGLPLDAALALYEARLRRPLSDGARAAFAGRWAALEGLPQLLVKDAEALRAATPGASQPAGPGAATSQAAAGGGPELTADDRELLTLTAALGGVPLGTQALAELSHQPDAAARLASLEDRGLTQSHSPRYSATGPSSPLLQDVAAVQLRQRMLAYFIDRAERGAIDRERPRDDLDPIVALLRWGQTAAPHADVLRLARASDTIAAGAGLWDAWRTILDIGLQSARAIGDRDGEAWALHQLGTRALCLEDELAANRLLREALRLRRAIGDRVGAANTQHNMHFLPGGPAGPGSSEGGPPIAPRSGTDSGGAAAGGAGDFSLLAPASWPLVGLFAAIVLVIGGVVAASPVIQAVAGTQDVSMRDPSSLLRDRPVLSPECEDRKACALMVACSTARACADPDPGPGPDPEPRGVDERRDDLTDAGGVAPTDGQLDVRWERVRDGQDPSPARFQTGPIDGRRPLKDSVDETGGSSQVDPDPAPVNPRRLDLDPIRDLLSAVTYGSSEAQGSDPAPSCDHFVAVRIFIQKELGLPAKLLARIALAEIVHEQLQLVEELIDGLHCSESDGSALLARLLAPLLGDHDVTPRTKVTP